MSYFPIPQRPGSPDNDLDSGTSASSPYCRDSKLPLLPTAIHPPSPSLGDKGEPGGRWGRQRGGAGARRRRYLPALVLLAAVGALSALVFTASENEYIKTLLPTSPHFNWGPPALLMPRPPSFSRNSSVPDGAEVNPLQNPLFPRQDLDFDENLFIEYLPSSVPASSPSSLIFNCRHENLTMCASAYRVLFVGPTIHSPAWNDSKPLADDPRKVEVKFDLRDPGEYRVYAWPEHETCDQWNHGNTRPYFQLAVTGTPAALTVEGPPPMDGHASCMPEDDLTNGRWIAKDHIDPEHYFSSSPFYEWLQSHLEYRPTFGRLTDYTQYGYIWAPYSCKPYHHSIEEWVEIVKPESFLMFGDSLSRDHFCLNYSNGTGTCNVTSLIPLFPSDKYIPYQRTSDNGTSSLRFHWEPLANPARIEQYITSLPEPPTHIFFNIALWITRENGSPEYYVNRMRPFLETLVRVAPNAKIVARTSGSAVQPIACYDLWNIRRLILEPVNAAFLELLEDFPSITALDAYPIYNANMLASEDGRHYERLTSNLEWTKPEEGSMAFALTDLVFEGWRQAL
ncbi:hypothetical protein JCM1841_006446 [Sporobolomyces salmonicolor]